MDGGRPSPGVCSAANIPTRPGGLAMHALALSSTSSIRVLLATFVASLLVACASNPIAVAETPAQKYAAIKLTYDAVLSGALELVRDQSVPAEVRTRIQQSAAASGEIYRNANAAYVQFVAARAELAAGQTRSEKLDVATANLERWLGQLETVAGQLAAALDR